MLRLLSLLQQRPVWSGPELAERLGVTTRSVRRDVERLRGLGYPVLAGLSRKSLLGTITGRGAGDRLAASVAAALAAITRGVRIVRVHDVAATVDALAVWNAVEPWPALRMREQAQQ